MKNGIILNDVNYEFIPYKNGARQKTTPCKECFFCRPECKYPCDKISEVAGYPGYFIKRVTSKSNSNNG